EKLRKRCEHAHGVLLWQLMAHNVSAVPAMGSGYLADDEGMARRWRELCQRLIDSVIWKVRKESLAPIALSVVHPNWVRALREIEEEQGPRRLAQNLLSTSLSTAMPSGYRAEAAQEHMLRCLRFTDGVK